MSDLIPNSQRHTRLVIFDRNHQVTTIQTAKRNPPAVTTYQIIDKLADYKITTIFLDRDQKQIPMGSIEHRDRSVCKIEHCNDGTLVFIFNSFMIVAEHKFINSETRPLKSAEFEALLDLIPPPIKEYLLATNPSGERFNLIPDGYGWDGKHSNSELIRANKVKSLLIGEYEWKGFEASLVEMICNEVLYTPSRHITTDWRKAIQYEEGNALIIGGVMSGSKVYVFGQTKAMSELLTVSLDIDENGSLTYTPDDRFNRYVIVSTAMIKKPGKEDYGVRVKLYEKNNYEQSG